MVQSYLEQGMEETAVFEFFVRELPDRRGFLLAAGLEQALDFLEEAAVPDDSLRALAATGRFSSRLIHFLETFRFTGDVDAIPEGEVFFADEPAVCVRAPLPQAQILETRLINLLQFQTLVASKAARCVLAAPGRSLIDFGLRRAHGAEAGLLAARASYLAGFDGSSTVLGETAFGVPAYGTMAHSFIEAHPDETAAFESFARTHPDNVLLLIDTYDTEAGARAVVNLAPRLRRNGIRIKGVRLDSGDLEAVARSVRRILDEGGLDDAVIVASGGLDETDLLGLVSRGAPIDAYGIGSKLDTSSDLAFLNCAYKLVEYAGRPTRKLSPGKVTLPGRKQVHRLSAETGCIEEDRLALADEEVRDGRPLLVPVMRAGQRLGASPSLASIRRTASHSLATLPEPLRSLQPGATVPVRLSERLEILSRKPVWPPGISSP